MDTCNEPIQADKLGGIARTCALKPKHKGPHRSAEAMEKRKAYAREYMREMYRRAREAKGEDQ